MVEFGKLTPPSPSSALPPQDYIEAVPKYISGRTSYLRVRLAFHLYPQLIPYLCTGNGFGPSPRYYLGFNLAMGSSPGFGSNPNNLSDIVESPPPASFPRFANRPLRGPPCGRTSVNRGLSSPVSRIRIERTSEKRRHSAGSFDSDRSRPIRTRFRCGSGTTVP